MNVKSLFSKWLFVLLIVAGIFTIGSIDVFAGDDGNTQDQNGEREYTIVTWRNNTSNFNYQASDFYNIDVLCSSSTKK